MTFSKIGRILTALFATATLGLGMTACGGGTIGYMWVLGTFYNQISGFQIDDYTGNLTGIPHAPFSSGGSNPVALAVKPGGRFLYVINSGSGLVGTPNLPACTSGQTTGCFTAPAGSGIAVFAVGGNGVLTFQQNYFSQGLNPIYAAIDGSGNFLYVLDKFAPDYTAANPNGSITVFQIAGDTGRLSLIPNTGLNGGGKPPTFFEVGPNPIMTKIGFGGCLFTLSPNSIYPYALNASNGQLTPATTGPYPVTGSVSLTSINTSAGTGGAAYTYLTDGPGNQIFSLQAGGTQCSFAAISGSQQANLSGTGFPSNSVTSSNGQFLYVSNLFLTGAVAPQQSSISAFTINSQGQLAALADGTNNPYATGSGPVCLAQDPTGQYLYSVNSKDSTVTGKLVFQSRGYLSDLQHGSVFPTTMNPTCFAISGSI